MGIRKTFIFALSLLLSLPACETDVDLFTEHGEVPVVYALLEPHKDIQIFRINPTFTGDGDARIIAGDPSLTNYAAGEIEVKLINLTNDQEFMLKDSIVNLEEGGIFGKENRVYCLETPIDFGTNGQILNSVLIADNEYQLEIKNTKSGKIYTSSITLGDINLLSMVTPETGLSQFSRDFLNFYSGSSYNSSYTFEFKTDDLSERFSLDARFYYTQDSEDKDSKARFVDFSIGERNEVESFDNFLKEISIDFNGELFYSILSNKLSAYPARTGQTFDLTLTAVGKDLDVYVAVQEASLTGVSQEVPGYSNIDGGLGIFSFRLSKTFTEFKLNLASAEQLFEGSYTFELFNCCRFGTQNNSQGDPDYCR